MSLHRTEAIILNATPFQDHHQIVSFFTPDLGLCKGICLHGKSPKNPQFGIFSPLHHVEVIFRESRNDLLKIQTGSLLNAHPFLRTSFDALQAACKLLAAVSKSQFPHKPAPMLFQLLKSYLEMFKEAKSPKTLLASFQLKLLRHEGLLAVTNRCALCQEEPACIALHEGQVICGSHRQNESPDSPYLLSEEETALFYALALSTSISLLQELEVQDGLASKIQALFDTSFG
jgi:DNA repair protein RecO (recombination protein O)